MTRLTQAGLNAGEATPAEPIPSNLERTREEGGAVVVDRDMATALSQEPMTLREHPLWQLAGRSFEEVLDAITKDLAGQGTPGVLSFGGSHSHGTSVETSDVDVRGVFVYGRNNNPSLRRLVENVPRDSGKSIGVDIAVDSLTKALQHALEGKFSIVEQLFVPKDCIWYLDPRMQPILDNRDKLISHKWASGLKGYFQAQAKNIEDKGTGQGLGRIRDKFRVGPADNIDEQYDAKFVMHAVRLANIGFDIVNEGRVLVRRPEAEFLRQIRRGEAFPTRTAALAYLKDLDLRLGMAFDNAKLPDPDYPYWEKLYRDVEFSFD